MKSISRVTLQFLALFLEGLDCPRALTVAILLRNKEYEQIIELSWDPFHYNSLVSARDSLAATSILSKFPDFPVNIDRKATAIKKFLEAEDACRTVNETLWRSATSSPFDRIISIARREIHRVLGDGPDTASLWDACNWGPGASTRIKRAFATAPNKFAKSGDHNRGFTELYEPSFRAAFPSWEPAMKEVQFNKVVTVPKNAKTDRVIAIEPCLNLWVQKGLGVLIRRRILRYYGIDLNTQLRNQELAKRASKGNDIATVDFSSASDTISIELVYRLLPTRWFICLERIRSRYGCVDGQHLKYQKFSSMGNGYTFELESLIFLAIARAIAKVQDIPVDDILIFGDDLTLPSRVLDQAVQVFSYVGFTINKKKSYSSGYYRESCGEHYWNGVSIKPIFLKEQVDVSKETLLKYTNALRRLSHRRNSYGCDRALFRCWSYLSNLCRGFPRISDGYGDVGVIENFDHPDTRVKVPKHQFEGFLVPVWVRTPVMVFYDHHGLLLSRLKSIGSKGFNSLGDLRGVEYGNFTPMPCRTRLVRKNLLIPAWLDLGPWI